MSNQIAELPTLPTEPRRTCSCCDHRRMFHVCKEDSQGKPLPISLLVCRHCDVNTNELEE